MAGHPAAMLRRSAFGFCRTAANESALSNRFCCDQRRKRDLKLERRLHFLRGSRIVCETGEKRPSGSRGKMSTFTFFAGRRLSCDFLFSRVKTGYICTVNLCGALRFRDT